MLRRFSRLPSLENRDEPVGDAFPLFSRAGNENLRDVFRLGVVSTVCTAVEVLAVLADLVWPLTAGAEGAAAGASDEGTSGRWAASTSGLGSGAAEGIGSTAWTGVVLSGGADSAGGAGATSCSEAAEGSSARVGSGADSMAVDAGPDSGSVAALVSATGSGTGSFGGSASLGGVERATFSIVCPST
jgi:hypothetical protein